MYTSELDAIIRSGNATDEQIAEFLGLEITNSLSAERRGDTVTGRIFLDWYLAVLEPIGVELQPAFAMFTGNTSLEEFALELDDATVDRFLDEHPARQAAFSAKIDRGETLT